MRRTPYNELEVRTVTAGGEILSRAGIGIQVLIDGTVHAQGEDYYVNIDSFFEALGQQSGVIEFIGGCHLPACCAIGAWTTLSPESWCWNKSEIRLRWPDVYKAADWMLKVIDEHSAHNEEVWCAIPKRIPFYRTQLQVLATRVHNSL